MKTFSKKILICGGAGFIGSHFADLAISQGFSVVVLDLLTYAGHRSNLANAQKKGEVELVVGNICNGSLVTEIMAKHKFQYVVNFAAESHVDRSIAAPRDFIDTNIVGTFNLLAHCRSYFDLLTSKEKKSFRFLQVSTDEVFGELGPTKKFNEKSHYSPRSPYSASKAAADHLVRAWHATYGLPTLITNCSNNYGPRQHSEKLIPLMIQKALAGETLPVYGRGDNIRDWIHVSDHCQGIWLALTKAKAGESFCFGGNAEKRNIEVVNLVCEILDKLKPCQSDRSYKEQISFVTDRLGHDYRYAIDDTKALRQLGFDRSIKKFEMGLESTIHWYLENQSWYGRAVA